MNRRGFIIPIAFIALALFAILGISVMMTGSSDYSQTSKVYYGTKATVVAASVHEELQCVLYKIFSTPLPEINPATKAFGAQANQIRQQLLDEIKQKVEDFPDDASKALDFTITIEGTPSGNTVDGSQWLPNSRIAAQNMGVEILLAEVKFYGFRLPNFSGTKYWQNDLQFYRCPYGLLDSNPTGRETNKANIVGEDGTGDSIPEPGTGDDGSGVVKEVKAVKDYIGYYAVKIITSCSRVGTKNIVTREHVYNHDVKIVNVAPLAREFALFSYASTARSEVPPEFAEEDLNKGGGLKIYPNRWGRVYMKGPYLLDTEGWSSGTGGFFPWNHVDKEPDINPTENGIFRPTVANTYPRYKTYNSDPAKNNRSDWWGWAFLPSQRAPTLQDLLLESPGRPLLKKDWRLFGELRDNLAKLTHHRELYNFVASLTWDDELAGMDPAPNIKLTSAVDLIRSQSRWLCSAKDADIHNRAFCFVGDPVDGAHTAEATPTDIATPGTVDPDEYRFSMYRGIYGEWVHPDIDTSGSAADIEAAEVGNNGDADVKDPTAPVFKAIRPFWTKTMDWGDLKEDEPDSQDPKLYAIHPEGMILGKFGTVSFTRTEFGAYSSWETKPIDDAQTVNCVFPYALRWESAHKEGLFKYFLRSFAAAMSMVLPGGVLVPSVAGMFGRAVAIGSDKYLGISQDGENFDFSKQEALKVDSFYPPGFRPLNRLAVRRYRRLESLIPKERHDVPLKLDGVLWCDDFNTEMGFKYFGRGMVVSSGLNPQAGAEDKHTMKCPILPQLTMTDGDVDKTQLDLKTLWNDDPEAKAGDGTDIEVNPHYLTIAITRPDRKNDYKANRSLIFKTDEDQPNSGYVAASIMAPHGISTLASKNIHVVGNYVCRLVNKQQIPGDGDNPTDQSNIYVSYDQRFYPERWKLEDDGTYTEASGGGREELDGESEIKAVPSVSPEFTSHKFYSFNLSRKMCGVRFGLSKVR